MSLKRSHSAGGEEGVYVSTVIEDRSSTFVAHFSPFLSAKQLQKLPDFQHADHRIIAWRKASSQTSLRPEKEHIYDTGHDDDGEKWAGKRLETVLSTLKVEGAIVVARWFGGVMLGPVRFNHIENCAREAVAKYLKDTAAARSGPAAKRAKTAAAAGEDDAAQKRAALIAVLEQRDDSIVALRRHEALRSSVKNEHGSVAETGLPTPSQTALSPRKSAYETMTVEQLQRLEKGRDATIGFLLMRIERAEKSDAALAGPSRGSDGPSLAPD